MAPSGFAAALIAALEDAQAAAAQPKPAAQLAETAWNKLQFDFPVVSADELAALVQEFATGQRSEVTLRFLAVLRDGSAAPGPAANEQPAAAPSGSSSVEGDGKASSPLVPLYQQLYAVAVLCSLQACLEAPEAEAAARLSALQPEVGAAGSLWSAEGQSQMEQVLAAAAAAADAEQPLVPAELAHRLSQQEDDDSTEYEPLEPVRPATQPAQQQQQQEQRQRQQQPPVPGTQAGATSPTCLPEQLARLADHLSYHCMVDPAAWRELQTMQRVAACLAAARQHPCFAELGGVTQPLLRLAADRWVASPVELEAGLPALLDALAIPGSSSTGGSSSSAAASSTLSSKQSAAAAAAAAELALAAAVALAAHVNSPSARRQLWAEVNSRLLPVAGKQLEEQQVALARAARAAAAGNSAAAAGTAGSASAGGVAAVQLSAEQVYRIMLPCQLLYFFILEAPRTPATLLQDALLKAGLLRSLVLLFSQLGAASGAEPLRCALLLACTAAQPLADWAAAVPGFTASLGASGLAPGGDAALHGALWRLLQGGGGRELAGILLDATPADKVPGVLQALQLMADMQAVSRRSTPLWDGEVEGALRTLASTLRQHYSRQRQEAAAEAASNTPAPATASGRAAEAGAGEQAGEQASPSSAEAAEEAAAAAAREDEEDAKKLGVSAEEQAAVLSSRHAARLQPACLKLIKDLLHRRPGGGKHD